MHTTNTNHTDNNTDARLRRQFERGERPRHHFHSAEIPDYPVFHREQLSDGLRQKLDKRKALGYEDPRAMTRDEISDWDLTDSVKRATRVDRLLRAPKRRSRTKPAAADVRAERELDKQHERDRIAAETYRYGGPLQLPPTPVVRFASTLGAIAMLVGGVSGFAMVGALLGALSDGHWRPLATLGVVCLVSFAVVMLTFTVHVDRSGDLTDADREEIDSAIEHISLSRGDYKEYRLAEYAAALAQRIAHSPAWASNFLESHRIELNYREELRDITIHAHRLRAIYLELGEPPRGDTPQAVRARDRFDKASAPLEVIWRALVRRVAALESFTLHLAELDTQLANMEAVERATSLEDRIGNLLASAVSDEFAAAHTLSVTERSQDTSLSVEATLDALRSDIAGLTALSQSLPAQSEPS